jgi:hypothetical protein
MSLCPEASNGDPMELSSVAGRPSIGVLLQSLSYLGFIMFVGQNNIHTIIFQYLQGIHGHQ